MIGFCIRTSIVLNCTAVIFFWIKRTNTITLSIKMYGHIYKRYIHWFNRVTILNTKNNKYMLISLTLKHLMKNKNINVLF